MIGLPRVARALDRTQGNADLAGGGSDRHALWVRPFGGAGESYRLARILSATACSFSVRAGVTG